MTRRLPYDLGPIGRITAMFLLVYCAAEVAFIWHSTVLFEFYNVVEANTLSPAELEAEAAWVDDVAIYIAAIFLLTLLICMILSAMWIYRAASNAQAVVPDEKRIRPGWAVGWFAIPFANLVMPFRAMRQTWNGLHGVRDLNAGMPGWTLFWWLFWLGGNAASTGATRLNFGAQSIDEFRFATTMDVVASCLSIPAALLFRHLILTLTRASAEAFPHDPASAPIPQPDTEG